MELLNNILKEDFISKLIYLSKRRKQEIYLVGGFLRDAILNRKKENLDLDFAVNKDAIGFAREFAKQTKSGFVVLDKGHGCARVIYEGITLDFADFRGKDLKEDLLHRDFTINTLALRFPLRGGNLENELIDYYGALEDLKKGVIKVTSNDSLKEDYLRILRVFSLSAIFDFAIDKNTLSQAKKYKEKLSTVAGERLRDELYKILDVADSLKHIKLLDKLGILSQLVPQIELMRSLKQGPYHHLDVWGHSLETLRQLEILLESLKNDKQINFYLNEKIGGERKRKQLIKLICLLHDIGKPQAFKVKEGKTMFHGHERIGRDIADAVSEKLKLSTKEKFAIDTTIFWHLRPGYLTDVEKITERAKFRYFRDTKDEAVSVLLLSVADQRATRGPLANTKSRIKHEKIVFELIEEYFNKKKEKKFVRLINGDDLIKELKLTPSPLFKKILEEVEETQAEGKIKTKKQALELAEKIAGKELKK